MFVQVIKGHTSDAEGIRRQGERWKEDVGPGAVGFLGTTAGVAEDGTFYAIARFEDEAAARANSERPEQSAWWEEMSKYFDGEPTFRESSDVSLLFDGGSDAAGFVQVMEGTVKDRARAQAMEAEMVEQLRRIRPDLLGSVRVHFEGGAFVDTAYFTSEADAREGESSAEFEGPGDEFMELFGDMTFTDLKDPMFV
jgi:hypothetical protein